MTVTIVDNFVKFFFYLEYSSIVCNQLKYYFLNIYALMEFIVFNGHFFIGTLTLVDLAGSERLDDSANSSTNTETKKINLSLLELKKVLRSLRRKAMIFKNKWAQLLH